MARVANARSDFTTIASVALVGAFLYLARDFLIPVALAALLGFLLTPVVKRLESLGVPRAASVVLIALAILSAAALAAWFIAGELTDLAANLPSFKATLAEKLRALRGPVRSLADALGWIDRLSREIAPAAAQGQPAQVEIVEKPSPFMTLSRFVSPLLPVLGTAGVVAVLALFMLVQSDLPKRIVALLALHDSRLSPRALDEAGLLVSGFLGRLALVCLFQGVVVWLGLWFIGVPGAFVFGFIAALLRSIPYFGPTAAAALPIAFCLAAFHGFEMALWTIGFFVCLELFTNNVVDPRVLGHGAGLTPFGVILSATFWAWLWGPPGLILAIPLTACLTVVGRYVPQLAFLPSLLARDSVATPAVRLYERLVARDDDEAAAVLRHAASDGDLVTISDALVLPLLAHLYRERQANRCSRTDLVRCLRRLRELLAEPVSSVPIAERAGKPERALRIEALRESVVDRFARDWVATVLERLGFEVKEQSRGRSVVPGDEAATLVLTGVGQPAIVEALGAARNRERVRGRDAVLLAAGVEGRGLTSPAGVPIVGSCSMLIAALAPAPIARAEGAAEKLEALPQAP
jgi:predicted PurR-regulated permease PerM